MRMNTIAGVEGISDCRLRCWTTEAELEEAAATGGWERDGDKMD